MPQEHRLLTNASRRGVRPKRAHCTRYLRQIALDPRVAATSRLIVELCETMQLLGA